jgi:hypothetical protein
LKGDTPAEEIINTIEAVRCGRISGKPISLDKETWFSETALVKDFSGLADGVLYKTIYVELERSVEELSIPKTIYLNREGNMGVFKVGPLTIKVHEDQVTEFYNYLHTEEGVYKTQQDKFVLDVQAKKDSKEKLINLLRSASNCMLNVIPIEDKVNILKHFSSETIISENLQEIVVQLVKDIESTADQKYLLDEMVNQRIFMKVLKLLNRSYIKEFVFEVSSYINTNYPKPEKHELAQYYTDNSGIYNKLFLWEETAGQDILYHSHASNVLNKFKISAESDW